MRVLVTGAAGFLGSHLVDRLLADGHTVTAVDDLSTGRLDRLAAARAVGGLSFSRASVLDDALPALVARARPEVVCHLAVTRGTALEEVRGNVVGTAAVLAAAEAAGVRKLVLASDAAVYGRPRRQPVSERAGLAPRTAYAASRAAELVVLEPASVATTSLVLGRVYGPRQDTGAVAMMARALVGGRPATVFGDGRTVRDWLYVDDAVDAIVRATGERADGRRLNVASGRGLSVEALQEALADATGTRLPVDRAPAIPGELRSLVLEVGAARRALGWEPFTALPVGLAATVAALRG
ncbi:MAG: NAD-dependent epimerase/dehydratase family protein [Mycobacteriales bacterium]|nr:NAD-dependent epimerase/dehydratase family protein [Mycobacteriales bacterium]